MYLKNTIHIFILFLERQFGYYVTTIKIIINLIYSQNIWLHLRAQACKTFLPSSCIGLILRYATMLARRKMPLIYCSREQISPRSLELTSVFDCGADSESRISRNIYTYMRAFANTEIFHRASSSSSSVNECT